MQVNNNHHILISPKEGDSPSLAARMNERVELIDFITRLSFCQPEETTSMKKLANKLKTVSTTGSTLPHLIVHLIERQFPRPELDSIRELIANSMDANARSGRAEKPVEVTLKGNFLSIQDSGDGISNLVHFFVPGSSLNSATIFDPHQGATSVTGRFGQGALSIFYYLHGATSLSKLHQPRFTQDGNNLQLTFRIVIDHLLHELQVRSSGFAEGIIFTHQLRHVTNKELPSISIHSGRGDTVLRIKSRSEEQSIYLDIAKRKERSMGTTIKIRSPLLLTHGDRLTNYITNVFKSSPFPIILNGSPIQEKASCKLHFLGGTLTFTPIEEGRKGGTLRLCECGKLIMEFPLLFFVPEETTIDFKRVIVSQERASLDFRSETTRKEMEDLIDLIATTDRLKNHERSALFNALLPIGDGSHFNLVKKIQTTLTSLSLSSKEETIASLIDPSSINPDYFTLISLPPLFTGKNYKLYGGTTHEKPVVLSVDQDHHIFLHQRYLPQEERATCIYNLFILNHWLHHSGFTVSIDVASFCRDTFDPLPRIEEKTQKEPLPPFDGELDFERYTMKKPLSFKSDEERCHYFLDHLPLYIYPDHPLWQRGLRGYLLKKYSDLARLANGRYLINDEEVSNYLTTRFQRDQPQLHKILLSLYCYNALDKLHYVCDAFLSERSCFAHMREIDHPSFLVIIATLLRWEKDIQKIHTIVYAIHRSLQNKSAEERDYYLLCMNNMDLDSMESFNHGETVYIDMEQIINISGCKDGFTMRTIFEGVSYHLTEERIKQLKLVAAHIAHSEAAPFFLNKIHHLKFLDLLLSWPKEHLMIFLEILPDHDATEEDYKNILTIGLRNELPKRIRAQWASIYSYGASIGKKAQLNSSGFLSPLIHSFIDEQRFSSMKELKSVENGMTSALSLISPSCQNIAFHRRILRYAKKRADPSTSEEQLISELVNEYSEGEELRLPFPLYSLRDNLKKVLHLQTLQEKNDLLAIAAFFREEWEKNDMLTPIARPFIYALLLKEKGTLLSEDFHWRWSFDPSAILLQRDGDLIDTLGSEELARRRIQGAMVQSVQEYFFIKEFCKNSREAKATEISFEAHCDEEKNTIIVVRDDGSGMDLAGLKTLKTPNSSSKDQSGDDPNFGWGFFTVFRDFDEVVVISKKEGTPSHCLAFKKSSEGLLRQYFQTTQEPLLTPTGTTIYLKVKRDPLLSLIKLEAELNSSCKYFKDIVVRFQGGSVAKEGQSTIFQQASDHDLRVELGEGEEGIYCKELLMGALTQEYTHFLPQPIRQLFLARNVRLRLFLPHAKQVMNRNHLIADPSLLLKARLLITRLSLNEYLKRLALGDEMAQKILSEDYWSDFRYFNHSPTVEMKSIMSSLLNETTTSSPIDPKLELKKQLVEYSQKLLLDLKQTHHLSCELDDELAKLHAAFLFEEKEAIEKRQREQLQLLEAKYSEPTAFATFIVHYPWNGEGETLMSLRQRVQELLLLHAIILPSGEYDKNHIIKIDPKDLLTSLQTIKNQAMTSFPVGSEQLLQKFVDQVHRSCSAMQKQAFSLLLPDNQAHEIALGHFFKQIALNLGREVEIIFYSDHDNAEAHVVRGKNAIFINRRSSLHSFVNLSSATKQSDSDQLELLKLLSEMVTTIPHEIVHLEEDTNCDTTHDQRFKEQVADKLQQLFESQRHDIKSPLQLCKEFLGIEFAGRSASTS